MKTEPEIIMQGEGISLTSCISMESFEQICYERDKLGMEVKRLTWWLNHILKSKREAIDLKEMAHNAIAGDFAGPDEP
jgi:hypothetical protein